MGLPGYDAWKTAAPSTDDERECVHGVRLSQPCSACANDDSLFETEPSDESLLAPLDDEPGR